MYCTVLCLALLPFVSSNILDIFAGKSLLNFFIFFLCLLSSFVCLFSILGIPSFSVVWCIVSSLHIAVCFLFLFKFTDHCHLVETQLQSTNITSYFIKQPHTCSGLPYSYLESLYHLLRPSVFKIQHISDTESHAIQVGQAYNSVRFYLFIRSVSLATTIGPVRITFCRRKVM